jgi:hypothetical protein
MADTIRAVCPNCGAKVNAPAKLAGKRASCPKCSAAMTIPKGFEAPAEDPEEFAFASPPPSPPMPSFVPTPVAPAFERDDDDSQDEPAPASPRPSDASDRTSVLGLRFGSAAFNERFPNLTAYLVLIQLAAQLVAVCGVLAGLLSSLGALLVTGRYDIFTRMGLATLTFATHCLAAWLIYMVAMAAVELIRVMLQIEINTRPQLAEAGSK